MTHLSRTERDNLRTTIAEEMEVMRWAKKRGIDHLQKTYGVSTLGELSDSQLRQFYGFLLSEEYVRGLSFDD